MQVILQVILQVIYYIIAIYVVCKDASAHCYKYSGDHYKSTKTSRNKLPSYNQATIFTLISGKTTLLLKTRYKNFYPSSWFLFAFPKSFGQLKSNPSSIPCLSLSLTIISFLSGNDLESLTWTAPFLSFHTQYYQLRELAVLFHCHQRRQYSQLLVIHFLPSRYELKSPSLYGRKLHPLLYPDQRKKSRPRLCSSN